jgi:hypothetical protein
VVREDVLKDIILKKMMRVEDVFQIVKNVRRGIMNPDYPECQRIEFVCEKHPTTKECITKVTNMQNITSNSTK